MKKVILALTTVFCLQAQAQKADALIDEYITDRLTLQVSIGNNFDLYQPLNDANLVLIPIRDFRSFYSDYDVFAWNLEGQMSVALNPVWSLYAGASMGTMSGSNNTDYYRADMLSGDIGLKFNIANMRINRKRSRLTLVPLAGLSYNYFNSELFYLSDVTPQHSESGFAPGLNVGAELDFSLTKNIAVYGSMVRRGFQHDGLDGWDYGGNGDNYLRTNVGVKIKLTKTLESEHASDINIWDLVSNNSSKVNQYSVLPEEKDILEFKYRMNNYVVGDKEDYEKGRKLNPTLYVVRGSTYNIKNTAEDHPLRLSKNPKRRKNPAGLSKNGIRPEDGLVTWKIPMDAPEEYYYYSDMTDSIGGVIKVLGPNEEPQQADNREVYATINHILFELDKLRQREEQVFDFDVTDDHVTVGDESDYEDGNNEEPTIYVVRGQTYKMKNKANDKPLRFSKSPDSQEDPKGLEDNGITQEDGTVEWSIPLDAPEEYYYYSEGDDEVGGVIKVLGPGEAPESANDEIEDLKEEVESLKAMVMQAPADTSVTITTVQSVESSHVYEFDVTDDHVTVGDREDYEDGDNKEPIIYVVRGESYRMKNNSEDNPLQFSKSPDKRENPKGLEENGITEEDGTVEWVIPLDAPEEYYYYSEEDDDKVGGIIKVLGPNDDWKEYVDDEISKLQAQFAEGSRDTAVSITNVQMVAPAADDFIFEDQDSLYTIGENADYEGNNNQNPTIYVMRGQTYSFRNNSEDHPLRLSRKEAQRDDPRGLEKNAITKEDESVSWKIPHDAPDEYYYYSEANDTLRGIIKVVGQGEGDTYEVDMSQDFNQIVDDLQTRMEEELTNLKSADDIERFEGGHHLVLFYDVDIHILTRAQKKKIFEFVYALKKESEGFEYKLIISGFADVRASAAYNDALRQRRSNEVKKFLKQLGLEVPTEDRTAPHTYTGEMFLDRRVELTIEVTRTID